MVLLIAAMAILLCGLKPAVLSANALVNRLVDTETRVFPVAASAVIYRGALVGIDPAGMLKPFVPGDVFVGIAYEAVTGTSTAGAVTCRVWVEGDFQYTLASAAADDVLKPVYATADDAIALTGNYDAYVGRVLAYVTTNTVIVRLKAAGEEAPNGIGAIKLEVTGLENFDATGADGATNGNVYFGSPNGAVEAKSILGTGVSPNDAEGGGVKLTFDAVAEIALASVRTINDCLPVDKGLRMDVDLVAADSGDNAALDIDIGFGTALTTNSEADVDHADMVNLAALHIDGASDNILAQSDNNVTDVAPVDTTIDNDSATDVPKHLTIIVRPTGAVEFWINNARVLSSTTFAVDPTANLAAFINMEKTADNTTAELVFRNLRITAGALPKAA
jgi:hypothetical protein